MRLDPAMPSQISVCVSTMRKQKNVHADPCTSQLLDVFFFGEICIFDVLVNM